MRFRFVALMFLSKLCLQFLQCSDPDYLLSIKAFGSVGSLSWVGSGAGWWMVREGKDLRGSGCELHPAAAPPCGKRRARSRGSDPRDAANWPLTPGRRRRSSRPEPTGGGWDSPRWSATSWPCLWLPSSWPSTTASSGDPHPARGRFQPETGPGPRIQTNRALQEIFRVNVA